MSDRDELERLRTVLAHVPGYIIVCDLDARITFLNRVAHGYKMEDTLGANYYEFLAPEQAAPLREAHAAVVETGEEQTVDYYLDTPEGGRRHMVTRIAADRDDDGRVKGFINVVADVTDRRLAEERLAELEAQRAREELAREVTRNERVLEIMIDGYLLIDSRGTVIACNRSAAEQFDRTVDEMTGQRLGYGTLSMEPSFDQAIEHIGRESRYAFDATHVTHTGRTVECRINAQRVESDGDALYLAIMHDRTEERRAEREHARLVERMQQQHRLHSLGTLAGGAAHEINNPVQSIISFSELIKRRCAGEAVEQFADEILSEAHRIAKIVRNLSTFARADSENHSPARVADIVDAALGLLRHSLTRDGISVSVELPPELPPVKCRSQQIRQVVVNLVSNARDALNAAHGTDGDKQLRVTACIRAADDAHWMRLTVEDNGEGISADDLPHVFDPFFTTRQQLKRSGLGLAVSHGIATEHHGDLVVESRPGSPTRVHLDLRVDNGWTLDTTT